MNVARSSEDENPDELIHRLGQGVASDTQMLPIVGRKINSTRVRNFESAVGASGRLEEEISGVEGPQTVDWCMLFVVLRHSRLGGYLHHWKQLYKLTGADWGVAIHALMMRGVSLALCHDQVDGMNMTII